MSSLGVVGTEGCQLNGSGGYAMGVHMSSTRTVETRGGEVTIGGCDYFCTQFLLRPQGLKGTDKADDRSLSLF